MLQNSLPEKIREIHRETAEMESFFKQIETYNLRDSFTSVFLYPLDKSEN